MINRAAAIFYLVLLTFYLIRPVLPYIDYNLRKDYIIKYLCEDRDQPNSCCQGKCYLDKQIAQQSESGEPDNKHNRKISNNNEVKEFLPNHARLSEPVSIRISQGAVSSIKYKFSLVEYIFVPPRQDA